MSVVNLSEIFISQMSADDINDVIEIEAEAYGEHHWSKSSFYDEMNNNLAKYYVAKTSSGELFHPLPTKTPPYFEYETTPIQIKIINNCGYKT